MSTSISEAFRILKEHATTEQDPDKLQGLLVQVNQLLDLLEMRTSQLEDES
jgi:hypothetical protein